jgi:hypothetical protein
MKHTEAEVANICNSINSLEDVYEINGTSKKEVIIFKNPINKRQRFINACNIINEITKAYNGDIELDWNDFNQRKYYLYFTRNAHGGGWSLHVVLNGCYGAVLGSGCYFANIEHAKDAYSKFPQVWIDFLPE